MAALSNGTKNSVRLSSNCGEKNLENCLETVNLPHLLWQFEDICAQIGGKINEIIVNGPWADE